MTVSEVEGTATNPSLREPRDDAQEYESPNVITRDSGRKPVLSVVMPTRNEEAGIATCIHRAKRGIDAVDVPAEIIVSDSSADRTPDIARSQGAIVVTPTRTGYGYAYRTAFEQARGEYIVMGDADCTYDFSQIPRLFGALQRTDADIVLGSRFIGEIKPGAMPLLHRYVGNPVLTELLNVLYGLDVTDAHSGYRIFPREILDVLDLGADGMEFASEMIVEASRNGLTIEEVPITYYRRRGEAELDSLADGLRHVRYLFENASLDTMLSW